DAAFNLVEAVEALRLKLPDHGIKGATHVGIDFAIREARLRGDRLIHHFQGFNDGGGFSAFGPPGAPNQIHYTPPRVADASALGRHVGALSALCPTASPRISYTIFRPHFLQHAVCHYAMMESRENTEAKHLAGGDWVDFVAVVDQVMALLRQRGRVAYRTLKVQFHLDDDALEALKDELLYAHQIARDEDNRILVWTGDAGSPLADSSAPTVPSARAPLTYTPSYLAEKILTSRGTLE